MKPGSNTVGRSSQNAVPLADDSASRVHAEFVYEPAANRVTLRDLGSKNGTFVNRERISGPRLVQPDDVVRIGYHVLSLASVPGLAVSSSLDLNVTLNVLLDQITGQPGVDAASVLLLNTSSQVLTSAAARGFHPSLAQTSAVRLGVGQAGLAAL